MIRTGVLALSCQIQFLVRNLLKLYLSFAMVKRSRWPSVAVVSRGGPRGAGPLCSCAQAACSPASVSSGRPLGPVLLLHPAVWVPASGGRGSRAACQHNRPCGQPTWGPCSPGAAEHLVSRAWCLACGSQAMVTARPRPSARMGSATWPVSWRVVTNLPPLCIDPRWGLSR